MKRGTCELERWRVGTSYLSHRLIFDGENLVIEHGKDMAYPSAEDWRYPWQRCDDCMDGVNEIPLFGDGE